MEVMKRKINTLTNLLIGYQTGLIRPTGSMCASAVCRAAIGNIGHCGIVSVELPAETIGKNYAVILMEANDEHSSVAQAQAADGVRPGGLG